MSSAHLEFGDIYWFYFPLMYSKTVASVSIFICGKVPRHIILVGETQLYHPKWLNWYVWYQFQTLILLVLYPYLHIMILLKCCFLNLVFSRVFSSKKSSTLLWNLSLQRTAHFKRHTMNVWLPQNGITQTSHFTTVVQCLPILTNKTDVHNLMIRYIQTNRSGKFYLPKMHSKF